jgi:hypothetical protein
MNQKVEFIESYIKIGNGDYQWNDNHGELIRCKDCKYAYLTDDGECKHCEMEKDDNGFLIERYRSWDWFCADGERRE